MEKGWLGVDQQQKIFIISAPAGTGKSTLTGKLLNEFSDEIEETCSCTTRAPREGEQDGKEYYFLSDAEFDRKKAEGAFIESACFFKAKYGTLKSEINRILSKQKHVIAVLDVQGTLDFLKQRSAVTIFIAPPSFEEQKRRLLNRNTEEQEMLSLRLERSSLELEASKAYDYYIENVDIDKAYQILRSIFIAEGHKQGR